MFLVGLSLCARAQIRDTLIISQSDVTIELDNHGYHHIRYGSNYVMEAGAPELPIVTKRYYIPHGAEDVQLIANVLGEQNLESIYNIYPSQGAVPTNQVSLHFAELSEEWNDTIYPSTSAEIVSDNRIFGYRIVTVCFHPFVYDVGNKVLTTRNVAISLDYAIGAIEDAKASQSAYRRNKCLEYVKNLVENAELLEETEPIAAASTYSREVPIRLLAEGRPIPDFIIITNEELKPAFKRLAEWKTRRGIFTVIETTEYIDSVCPGIDLCEKIRNYIKEKEEYWGEGLAILLGGDIDIIPARTFVGEEGEEVTDFYYVCNNYSNLLPNKYNYYSATNLSSTIGRFPVGNIKDAKNLIEKGIAYERGVSAGVDYEYIDNALISSGYLAFDNENRKLIAGNMSSLYNYVSQIENKKHWCLFDFFNQSGPVVVGGKSYDLEDAKTGLEGYGGELTRGSFLNALSGGVDGFEHFHFVYHSDHSGPFSLGASQLIKNESVTIEDIKELAYGKGYYQVILSGGCHPADFSTSCIAEELLNKTDRGAVAFMGNTDVGYGSEHYFLDVFYRTMYNGNIWDWQTHLGNVWLNTLVELESRNTLYSRLTSCRFHLLGDPTLAFWTEQPVAYRNWNVLQGDYLTVMRPGTLKGKGTTICVSKENEVYLIDTLQTRTQTSFFLRDIKTSGYVYITATGPGQKPQLDSVYVNVANSESSVEITEVSVNDDIAGNRDGVVSAGETATLNIIYKNITSGDISNIPLSLRNSENDPHIQIVNGNNVISSLSASDTCVKSFTFKVLPDSPNMVEHNRNAISIGCYAEGFLQTYYQDIANPAINISSASATLTSEDVYDVHVEFCCLSDVDFDRNGVAVLNKPFSATHTEMIEDTDSFSVNLREGEVAMLKFKVYVPDSDERNIGVQAFNLNMEDSYGNKYSFGIYPFAKSVSGPSESNVTFQPDYNFIDISMGNTISEVLVSDDGVSFNKISDGMMNALHFRHQNLSPQTTYYYKLRSKSYWGRESELSETMNSTTLCKNFASFPNIVEHSSAFRGLINSWDVDRDGKQEIFAATWDYLDDDGRLIAVKSSGEDMYSDNDSHMIESFYQSERNFMNGVAIGELYDDGEKYIVSATYSDNLNTVNSVYCHKATDNDGDGYPDLHWKLDSTLINSPRSPVIADLDGDDINEVIVPSINNVTILGANGIVRKTIPSAVGYKHLAVANVIPNSTGKQLIVPNGKTLAFYDSNGTSLQQYSLTFSNSVSTPIICDYDNDGYKEAIVGELVEKDTEDVKNALDSIYIYAVKFNNVGSSMKKLFEYPRHLAGRMDAPFVVGDLDNDNKLEVVAVSVDSIIIYNSVIEEKQGFPLVTSNAYHHLPLLADIDGDESVEIIYQDGDVKGTVYAYNYTANTSHALTNQLYTLMNDGFAISDIDGDGCSDIVCGTQGGRLYLFGTKGNPDSIEWGYSRANPQNTGEYGKIQYPRHLHSGQFSEATLNNDLYVMGNCAMINCALTFAPHTKIVVWENGVLNLHRATFNNARIIVKPGGLIKISDGTVINLRDDKSFNVPQGAQLRITNGTIK